MLDVFCDVFVNAQQVTSDEQLHLNSYAAIPCADFSSTEYSLRHRNGSVNAVKQCAVSGAASAVAVLRPHSKSRETNFAKTYLFQEILVQHQRLPGPPVDVLPSPVHHLTT